jgi:hypothetical protein
MAYKRVTLSLPDRSVERLEAMKIATSSSSITEVVKQAIMTLESIIKLMRKGYRFQAVSPEGNILEVEFMIDVEVDETASRGYPSLVKAG